MSFLLNYWTTIAAVFSAFLLGWLLSFWRVNKREATNNGLSAEYIQGFNYLVNDQSDKAVEVFVKALEVDSETVELHLALGGLFRKEGQVGRATRIHQNIIARPYLTDDQNRLAVFELAQDYFKAGLFDRAENLFLELVDRKSYTESSLTSLLTIYELEKEWGNAINIANKLTAKELPDANNRISHYWCEIAKVQLKNRDFEAAKKSLSQARSIQSDFERVLFLEGKVFLEMKNSERALKIWQPFLSDQQKYSEWVTQAICDDISVLGSVEQAIEFLHKQLAIHCNIPFIEQYLGLTNGSSRSWRYVLECIETQATKELVYWLLNQLDQPKVKAELTNKVEAFDIVYKGLNDSARNFNARKCSVCGFESNILNWQCPSCKRWDTQIKNN